MRTLLTLLFIASSSMVWAQKNPFEVKGGMQVDIKTSAICEMCKEAIEYDLTYTGGVKNAELNLENKVVSVIFNQKKITADEIRKRITLVGYNADTLKRDSTAYANLPFCCKDGAHGSGNQDLDKNEPDKH